MPKDVLEKLKNIIEQNLLKKLQQSSAAAIPSGTDKIKLKTVVDESIIGGLIVKFGGSIDKTIDLSVSGKVQKLNKILLEAL